MKYFSRMKTEDEVNEITEITKEEAMEKLSGYWKQEAIEEIFSNDLAFRLYTPYREIWTESDDGLVPIAGYYGIVG